MEIRHSNAYIRGVTHAMQWFKRHKIISSVLGIFLLLVIIGAANGGKSAQQAATQPVAAPQPAPAAVAAAPPAATPPPAAPKFDALAFYDKVQTGMTKAQVVAAAGKDSDNCSESQDSTLGKYESCTWNDGSFSGKMISVTLINDKVDGKSKFGY